MVQLSFNMLLQQAGMNPDDVILLRHQEQQVRGGLTPYLLWRDNRPAFEEYQSLQSVSSRKMFRKPYWASFVATVPSRSVLEFADAVSGGLMVSDQAARSMS
jgi:hypothetical protein